MKLGHYRTNRSGTTFWDVLIAVATVVVVMVVLRAVLHPPRGARGSRINCVNNLKQLALAMRMWSNDHDEHFPWAATNENQEAVLQSVASYFIMASNELNNAKILTCQKDPKRRKIEDFAKLTDSNISYFIGLDAKETEPQSILAGDRNVSTNNRMMSGLVELTRTSTVRWTGDIHKHAGNIALGDGSVLQMSNAMLQHQVREHPTDPFRLLIP